jgi:hypothetical protein
VKQDIGDTSVGIIATAVNRRVNGSPLEDELHDSALVGGADLTSRFGNDEWKRRMREQPVASQLTRSRMAPSVSPTSAGGNGRAVK